MQVIGCLHKPSTLEKFSLKLTKITKKKKGYVWFMIIHLVELVASSNFPWFYHTFILYVYLESKDNLTYDDIMYVD